MEGKRKEERVKRSVVALGVGKGFLLLEGVVLCLVGYRKPVALKVPEGMKVKGLVSEGDLWKEVEVRGASGMAVGNFCGRLVAQRAARKRKYRRKGFLMRHKEQKLRPLRKEKKL